MGEATDLCFTPAIELRRLLRAEDLSAVDLVEALLRRIERLNPVLNAYPTVTADCQEARARGRDPSTRHPSTDRQPSAWLH